MLLCWAGDGARLALTVLVCWAGGGLSTQSRGVLHEVMELCQEQDVAVAEMRDIDVELSQMYKSLIEIVARMSGLQRRRVQV